MCTIDDEGIREKNSKAQPCYSRLLLFFYRYIRTMVGHSSPKVDQQLLLRTLGFLPQRRTTYRPSKNKIGEKFSPIFTKTTQFSSSKIGERLTKAMKAMISHLPWVCGCGETEFSLETHLGHKWGLETRVVGAKTSSDVGLNNPLC